MRTFEHAAHRDPFLRKARRKRDVFFRVFRRKRRLFTAFLTLLSSVLTLLSSLFSDAFLSFDHFRRPGTVGLDVGPKGAQSSRELRGIDHQSRLHLLLERD